MKRSRLAQVCSLLNAGKVQYLVMGAEAGQLHGLVRSTMDVDILLKRELKNVERALQALSHLPWGVAKELDAEEILQKPITMVGDQPRVDLHYN